ncbi:CoA-disulfide reductase [Vagococcus acidifermentans]|uniref:CoA-disulfide reductase n=1 Tax=Vagococcus acidifermentans TaxID=564710 RepID=A0A430AT07_9ENTE|nr:CoA-disulfide reductase [Vagococcus acidifermentans]RSU11192.1 CoA-disulfide reductase [Vagococcus acidifermentans]
MEIVVIGGVAAGMSAAAKAARTFTHATISVIEKEDYVSFGACGLPYYIGGEFSDPNELYARSPAEVRQSGIQLFLGHEVTSVDVDAKIVSMIDHATGKTSTKAYDKLVIASGALPIVPAMPGVDSQNVYTFTKERDANRLLAHLPDYQHVLIVGGGFIGVEVADQLIKRNVQVTLLEGQDAILSQVFDAEITEKMCDALTEAGVQLYTNELLTDLIAEDGQVVKAVTTKQELAVDCVIMTIGFQPNTAFLGDSLEKLPNGAIVVDAYGRTSVKDVFACGDCATVPHRLAGDVYLPLATGANKLGRIVGSNVGCSSVEQMTAFSGTLGSSAIKAGHYEAGSTGLNERQAAKLGLAVKTSVVTTTNHSNYYSEQEPLTIKMIYDAETQVLYGAQIFGKNEAVLRMTGLTAAIHTGMTTSELGFVDFAYAPPFASVWEALNVAGNASK